VTERRISGLYAIIDPSACRGRNPVEVARLALEGGASVLQWRDKRRDKGEQLPDVRAVRELCRGAGGLLIVNDHADLAMAVDADGVHVGQKDLPVDVVRRLVGDAMIVGASTNLIDEARRAEESGASYVAVGSIFPTASKDVTRPASVDRLREVRAAVRLPIVAIGGIDRSNIALIIEAGADAAAVISAVCGSHDPRTAAATLASAFAPNG
jgi:thiamine-phosphate diphosphorylase